MKTTYTIAANIQRGSSNTDLNFTAEGFRPQNCDSKIFEFEKDAQVQFFEIDHKYLVRDDFKGCATVTIYMCSQCYDPETEEFEVNIVKQKNIYLDTVEA